MQRLVLIACALAIVLVGLVAACGSQPVSRSPLTPSAPSIGSIQINGPTSIAPGQSAQFIAEVRLSDGTVKSSTSALRWRSSNTSVLQVSGSGLVTTGQTRGEAIVTADVLPSGAIRSAMEVVVLPDGTYRVVGSVREADAPVPIIGARVEVSGTSLSTTTDFSGQYRLYGVPPAAEIRVTANGFVTATQSVQLTTHATQNFQLALSGPRLSLNGLFTLAIDVVGTCSGSPALSADLQHRRYDALVTTTGSFVDVLLTESSRFKVTSGAGNRFSGRADPGGVTFTLTSFYGGFYYYYYYNPSIVERLSNGTHLVVSGTAATSRTGEGVSGLMNGSLENYDSRFPAFNASLLGHCNSSAIQLTLTPR